MFDVVPLPVPRLQVVGLAAGYGSLPVLFDVSLTVGDSEIVALLGPNGAGKTSCLRAIAGLLPISRGSVLVDGRPLGDLGPERTARLGVQFIPEGGGVLRGLTVTENLLLAGCSWERKRASLIPRLERAFDAFPVLAERRHQSASTLSGGERQMMALAQALMTDARLLLIDEASLGLAPRLVTTLFESIIRLRGGGRSVLLVEQAAHLALQVADRAYVMEKGRVLGGDSSGQAVAADYLAALYLDHSPPG